MGHGADRGRAMEIRGNMEDNYNEDCMFHNCVGEDREETRAKRETYQEVWGTVLVQREPTQ